MNEQNMMDDMQSIPYPYKTDSKADLLDKIRPDEIVEITRNKLMGKELSRSGNWETNPNLKDNAISELGAWDISNLILSVANSSTSISKLNDKEIRRRAYSLMETAVKMILANFREYKITNTAQIRFISDIVYSLTFIVMKQADAEGIRKMIIGTRSEHHVQTESSERKRSFFRK